MSNILSKIERYKDRILYEVIVLDKLGNLLGFIVKGGVFAHAYPTAAAMTSKKKANALLKTKGAMTQKAMGRRLVLVERTLLARVVPTKPQFILDEEN